MIGCNKLVRRRDKYKLLTMSRRVLLEKLIFTQLVKAFPTFKGTQTFSTMFTRAHYCVNGPYPEPEGKIHIVLCE